VTAVGTTKSVKYISKASPSGTLWHRLLGIKNGTWPTRIPVPAPASPQVLIHPAALDTLLL